jgi:hypothetical protein
VTCATYLATLFSHHRRHRRPNQRVKQQIEVRPEGKLGTAAVHSACQAYLQPENITTCVLHHATLEGGPEREYNVTHRPVLPSLKTVAVEEVVKWLPIVEHLVAVVHDINESAQQAHNQQQPKYAPSAQKPQ